MEGEIEALLPTSEEREGEEESTDPVASANPKATSEVKNIKRAKAWALRSVLKGNNKKMAFWTTV